MLHWLGAMCSAGVLLYSEHGLRDVGSPISRIASDFVNVINLSLHNPLWACARMLKVGLELNTALPNRDNRRRRGRETQPMRRQSRDMSVAVAHPKV